VVLGDSEDSAGDRLGGAEAEASSSATILGRRPEAEEVLSLKGSVNCGALLDLIESPVLLVGSAVDRTEVILNQDPSREVEISQPYHYQETGPAMAVLLTTKKTTRGERLESWLADKHVVDLQKRKLDNLSNVARCL
jgi:hypothetical protein